jgi:23S rRNA pseudouridine2605 synthase
VTHESTRLNKYLALHLGISRREADELIEKHKVTVNDTNDGDFAHSMTHPSFHKTKVYQIGLDRALEPLHQQMIADYGVEIDDGTSKLSLERVDDTRKNWVVTMSEGRNRQIRRTFGALGYTVTSLHRTSFGPYSLTDLPAGKTLEIKK